MSRVSLPATLLRHVKVLIHWTVDTACSASLVAFHLACQSLRTGESRQAIVGGASVILSPDLFISMSAMRYVYSSGHQTGGLTNRLLLDFYPQTDDPTASTSEAMAMAAEKVQVASCSNRSIWPSRKETRFGLLSGGLVAIKTGGHRESRFPAGLLRSG